MFKKTIVPGELPLRWLLGVVLICGGVCLGAATDPSLMGWWQLNDSSGTMAADSSGKGNNATLNGKAAFAAGLYGGGVYCDGTEAYVALPNALPAAGTLAFWFKPDWDGSAAADYRLFDASAGDKYFFIAKGSTNTAMPAQYFGFFFEDSTDTDFQNVRITAAGAIAAQTWCHVAVTWQFGGGAGILYVNGLEVSRVANLGAAPTLAANPRFGNANGAGGVAGTNGAAAAFDDIKLFDRVLTAAEIPALMPGTAPGLASSPVPIDKAGDVLRGTPLSWTAGEFAQTHDVYFGASLQDVNSASRTAPGAVLVSKGQSDTTYDPGLLEFGKTYYWRIDEVNAPPSTKIFKGNVWYFTIEPYSVAITDVNATADSSYDTGSVAQKAVDGSGLDPNTGQHGTASNDMWVSSMTPFPHWIQFDFDKLYKLDQMAVWNSNQAMESMLGLGAKSVLVQYSVDGTAWTDLGNFVFTRAPGNATCGADTKVPFNGAAAKSVKLTISSNWGNIFTQGSVSEVRFYAIPVAAREPSPATGTADLHPRVAMSWRAGREASSHEVYVGSDANAVAAGATPTATVNEAKYDAALGLGQTYYWKVVEVNQATDPTSWASPVWSFSTATSITVDDFESYTNNSPNRVFQTWIDGSGFSPDEFFPNGGSGNNTGSLVGGDPQAGDIMELTYIYAGSQSMPLFYDNSTGSKISEATRTLDPATDTTDWSKYGLTTLVLFFRGDPTNGAAPVYIKINNTKKVYGVATATTIGYWKQWNIDLASLPAADLKNVQTLTIGVGDGSAGGSGKILVDDIRLYAAAPAVAVPTDPGTTGLEALYAMEGDAKDSSGKGRDGTLNGEPGFVDGPAGMGRALAFDGTNDYVDLPIGNLISTLGGSTFAARVNFTGGSGSWQRVFDFGTGTTNYVFMSPRQGTDGVMRTAITTGSTTAEQAVNGLVSLPNDGWHHMAVVLDDAAMRIRLYMDGVEVGSSATSKLPKDLSVTTQNWLGRSQWSGDAYLSGSLDDFRIYSRPLSEGEIRYLAGDR